MIKLHKIIASWLGIGYIGKGGGTIAAICGVLCWYVVTVIIRGDVTVQVALTLLTTMVGIWSAGKVEAHWGKDDKKVVIDEVVGMFISLVGLPVTTYNLLLALILFRFFDIVKPLYIRKAEKLPGGWGVMADDVLSGVYTNVIMWIMIYA